MNEYTHDLRIYIWRFTENAEVMNLAIFRWTMMKQKSNNKSRLMFSNFLHHSIENYNITITITIKKT
jgi:hypothetical protein